MLKVKSMRAVVAAIAAMAVMSTVPAISTMAMFEDDAASATSTTSDSVLGVYTFTATVTRVTGNALLVTADESANLGTNVAVAFPNASDFSEGDVVSITYSGAVGESGGKKSITADKIEKVSSAEPTTTSDEGPVVEIVDTTSNDTATDTTTDSATTTTTPTATTPDTGNAGVAASATIAVLSGGIFGAYTLLKRKDV